VDDDLVTGPTWDVQKGGVVPPERAGLGVERDRDAFGRYAEVFHEKGEFTYFDAA
jgi:L-alanine-DL-glutamate epimerase-like enolase superfamily enzyme